MNKKSRYNFSVVRHKKNLQRSLNRFSELHDVVKMYQMESDAWVFEFFDYDKEEQQQKVNQELYIEVFNRFQYAVNAKDTKFILSSIKNMFEYQQYQSSLIEIIKDYEKVRVIQEHIIRENQFLTQDKQIVLSDMKNKIEQMLKTEVSIRFIKQLYTSLHNRVKFPKMYYKSYQESLESRYSKMRKSNKTTSSNHFETTIRTYYNYYLKYGWLLEQLQTFNYHRNPKIDGVDVPENDEHVKSWRENYQFLQSNGIFDFLFQSMDFLATFIEIFSDDEMQPVSLTAKDGRIYERTIEKFLTDNYIDIPYNIRSMTQIYRALYKNIDKDTQYSILMGYLHYVADSTTYGRQ
jgi:hypothetical protein